MSVHWLVIWVRSVLRLSVHWLVIWLGEFPDRWREDLLVTWLAVIAACHTA